MADNERKSVPSTLPLIGVLVILIGAVMVARKPLESSRPRPPSAGLPAVVDANKVAARLWQDPFQVARDHERNQHTQTGTETAPDSASCSSPHCVNQIGQCIDEALRAADANDVAPALQLLLVMINDGQSAEDCEVRLRTRYALLTGLRASGMSPIDAEHIQYVEVPQDSAGSGVSFVALPLEQFEPETLCSGYAKDPNRPQRVLVVWLPENAFAEKPLQRIIGLLTAIDGTCARDLLAEAWKGKSLRVDLIGPANSTSLQSMIEEVVRDAPRPPDENEEKDPNGHWLRIYSPWSTASPVLLMGDAEPKEPNGVKNDHPWWMFRALPALFDKASVKFVRTVGTDDLLALHIIKELRQRGVHILEEDGVQDGVVLISEWDTFYGRAFPRTFAAMVDCLHGPTGAEEPNWPDYRAHLQNRISVAQGKDSSPGTSWPPENLHMYMRGVDGRLPEPPGQDSQPTVDKTAAGARWTYRANLEPPVGQGQLDYVRRLSQNLRDRFGIWNREKLKAIGVVGSDVYDKLILLHALREQFRNVILFTTDLDARLLHIDQFPWTHNLVVASSFPLDPDDKSFVTQRPPAFPPFRDSYQTAVFLACRAALEPLPAEKPGQPDVDTLDNSADGQISWLARLRYQPRIFEIGRGRAVDLSTLNGESPRLYSVRKQYSTFATLFTAKFPALVLSLMSISLLPVLGVPLVRGLGNLITGQETAVKKTFQESGPSWIFVRLLVGAGALGFVGLVLYDHFGNRNGEPFSLTSGTSVWPGLAIWLTAFFMGMYFVSLSRGIIERSNAHISTEFPLQRPSEADERGVVTVHQLWDRYLRTGGTAYRLIRAIGLSVLFLSVVFLLFLAFGPPFAPYRGKISRVTYGLLGIALLYLLTFLLFFAVDALLLGLRLVRPLLQRDPLGRPQSTELYWDMRDESGWTDWLTVSFIAHVTEAIGSLLYLPSIILLLLIAGRFWYFDNWSFPLPMVLIYLALGLAIVSCATALIVTARRARTIALESLNRKLKKTRFGPGKNPARAAWIEALIQDTQSLRQGAFRPLAENPVVHFLLIPSGGVGLLGLLAYVLPA
jgi:hypothetical protein